MIIWVDAQLSPSLAPWIAQQFGVDAVSVRRLGLRDAKDQHIFTSNAHLRAVLDATFAKALALLAAGENLVEILDQSS